MTLYEKLIPTSINESVITRFLFSTRIAARRSIVMPVQNISADNRPWGKADGPDPLDACGLKGYAPGRAPPTSSPDPVA